MSDLLRVGLLVCVSLSLASQSPAHAADRNPSSNSTSSNELSPVEVQRFLSQLRETLGDLRTLQVAFIQERRMAAFIDPLTAKGVCYFRAPDRIRWEVQDPYRSALVFDGGKVTKVIYDEGRPRKLNSGAKDILKRVLGFICLWMQGDFESTRDVFDIRITSDGTFLLYLTPRSTQLKDMIRSIRLTLNSESKHITNVTIQESHGDEIAITFLHEQWNAELDEDLFALQ